MAFFTSDEMDYRVLRLGGGSIHGISQAQVIIFLEELAGIPISWQYDMVSGDSIGACAASSLVCPKEKGSLKPKISAVEYEAELVRLCVETFEPYRKNYYIKMHLLEEFVTGLNFLQRFTQNWTQKKDDQIKHALDNGFHATREIMRKLHLVTDNSYDRNNPDRLAAKFNLCAGIANCTVLPLVNKNLEKARKSAKSFFFSAQPIHKAFDEFMRYQDGTPVLLSDAITGFHSDALNISTNAPAEHCFIKPIGSWGGFISHPQLPLSDIPFRSIAAQTVFKPYHSPHSNHHYDDIANQNTLASVMNFIRRKFTTAQTKKELKTTIKRHGLSIGTGLSEIILDPEKMSELGLLGRLDPQNGAPLLNASIIFNTTRAIRDLKEELGPEHAIFIDKVVDKNKPVDTSGYKKLMEKYNSASGILRAHHVEKMGKPLAFSIIDARPEKIEQLREFGWAMVWENLEVLVNEAKQGLYRAHRNNLISDRLLERRINHIDSLFPPEKIKSQERKKAGFMEFLSTKVNLSRTAFFSKLNNPANSPANDLEPSFTNEEEISPAYPSQQ